MAAKKFAITGPCAWAKIFEHNLDDYGGERKAKINILLDKDALKAFKATGSRLRPKMDDDGNVWVTFSRKFDHKIPDLGGVPAVEFKDGTPVTKLVGNGSIVTVFFDVYDTSMGPGTRMNKIVVEDLVEFGGGNGPSETVEIKSTARLTVMSNATSVRASSNEEIIPF